MLCNSDDPNRCQGSTSKGQCRHLALPGSEYCERHTQGNSMIKNYLLRDAALAQEVERHGASDAVKSLKEEIAISRTLLERRLNSIKDHGDLIAATGQIVTLLTTIERLVSSCHKMEKSLEILIGKDRVLALAQVVVRVLLEELEGLEGYEQIVDRVGARLIEELER